MTHYAHSNTLRLRIALELYTHTTCVPFLFRLVSTVHRPIYCECGRRACRACGGARSPPLQAPIPLLSPTVVDSPAGPRDDDLQRMMDRFNVPAKSSTTRGRTATLINMWRVQGVGKVAPKAMPDGGAGAVEVPAPPMV